MFKHILVPVDRSETSTMALVAALQIAREAAGQRLGVTIAEEAQAWESDLVVVGTHRRRGVSRVLPGSGAEQVIRMVRVPVLTIRGEEAPTGR